MATQSSRDNKKLLGKAAFSFIFSRKQCAVLKEPRCCFYCDILFFSSVFVSPPLPQSSVLNHLPFVQFAVLTHFITISILLCCASSPSVSLVFSSRNITNFSFATSSIIYSCTQRNKKELLLDVMGELKWRKKKCFFVLFLFFCAYFIWSFVLHTLLSSLSILYLVCFFGIVSPCVNRAFWNRKGFLQVSSS